MDGAASVFAAVSIAIQLAESVKKLGDFWKSVKEAPQDVQNIITDLDLLTDALCEIALEAQRIEPDATLESALRNCQFNTSLLIDILNELQPGFASSRRAVRKWTAFRSILKWDKIKKFQATVDRLKSTLMLMRQNQISRSSRIQSQQQQKFFSVMEKNMSQLHVEGLSGRASDATGKRSMDRNSSGTSDYEASSTILVGQNCTPVQQIESICDVQDIEQVAESLPLGEKCSVSRQQSKNVGPKIWNKRLLYWDDVLTTSFFGNISVSSRSNILHLAAEEPDKCAEDDPPREDEVLVNVQPASWMRSLGFMSGLSFRLFDSSIHGWKCSLTSIRIVSDDARIFKLCSDGNLTAVRQLLVDGHASVKDTTILGYTPLHVAAENHHVALCEFLITSGADRSAATLEITYPTTFIFGKDIQGEEQGTMAIDTCRLFLDSLEFSDLSSNGWSTLSWAVCFCSNDSTLEWLLRQVLGEVDANLQADRYMRSLRLLSRKGNVENLRLWLKVGPEKTLESVSSAGYTILLEEIRNLEKDTSTLLKLGANPHHPRMIQTTSRMESPTTLSMFCPVTFSSWRSSLQKASISLKAFLETKIHMNHTTELGWTLATLQRLFDWDFEVTDIGMCFSPCSDCADDDFREFVQPLWLNSIEEIKRGQNPEETGWHLSKDSQYDLDDLDSASISESSCDGYESDALIGPEDTTVDPVPLTTAANTENDESKEEQILTRRPEFPYTKDEIVCTGCWLEFCRTGVRRNPAGAEDADSASDYSTDDDYSPFHIHS